MEISNQARNAETNHKMHWHKITQQKNTAIDGVIQNRLENTSELKENHVETELNDLLQGSVCKLVLLHRRKHNANWINDKCPCIETFTKSVPVCSIITPWPKLPLDQLPLVLSSFDKINQIPSHNTNSFNNSPFSIIFSPHHSKITSLCNQLIRIGTRR